MPAYNMVSLPSLLTPALHELLREAPRADAQIDMNWVEDQLQFSVVHRYTLMTRHETDELACDTTAIAKRAYKRMRHLLGLDKIKDGRPVILARHRMNVRAKEARGLKRRRVSRMKRSRSHS